MCSIAPPPPLRQGEFYPLPAYYSVDASALLAGIEEKALRREFTGRPGTPLVSRSISHRAPLPHLGPLPPWSYFPPAGSTAYLRVYRKDVQVVRCHPETPPEARVPTPRTAIWEFSRKSRARLRHLCRNGGHVVRSQYLLTYHNQSPIDGRAVKRDLDRWLKAARRILGADLAYLWALEFQGRGVPHFHIFLSAPASPGSPLQRKLAAAWVRITQGTKEQLRFHCRRVNWIKWDMDDGSYLEKNYIAKREQKDVPDHYSNVGRFWGASRNFAPVPTIIEPETVAPWSAGWAPDQVQRCIVRTLRRYHERCMNYDRTTWTKRAGRKARRSPLRQGDTNGCHVVPYAAPILYQLLDYMAEHSPDLYAIRWFEKQVPF